MNREGDAAPGAAAASGSSTHRGSSISLVPRAAVATFLSLGVVVAFLIGLPRSASVLVGTVTGSQIAYFACISAVAAVAGMAFCTRARHWWFIPLIVARIGLVLVGLVGVMLAPFIAVSVTPLVAGDCPTGYVAVEPWGGLSAEVGVHEGTWFEPAEKVWLNGRTFAESDYLVRVVGDRVQVWEADATDDPALTLPLLKSTMCG